MNNHNLLLATIDILLALVFVFIANFAIANSPNTEGFSEYKVDEISRFEIIEDYPELNKESLNYIAFYIRSDNIQIINIVKGNYKNDTTVPNIQEMINWFNSNINKIRKDEKNLAIYEAETNNVAVSTLLRLATENKIRIGYADVRD